MGFYIPNAPNASVIDQSEPDSGDFLALGDRKTGVISGCAVTSNNDQTVAVAAGEVLVNGAYKTVAANSALSLGQGNSASARFDLVIVDASLSTSSSGVLAVRSGVTGSNPTYPTLNEGDVLLAAVYRAAGTGDTVSDTRITDKRIMTPSNVVRTGTGAPSNSLGSVGDIYINTAVSSNTGQSQVYVKTAANLWENLAEYVAVASENTANAIVQRNSSGNFSAGTITANLTGTATNVPWTGVTGAPTVNNVIVGTNPTPTYPPGVTVRTGDVYIQV